MFMTPGANFGTTQCFVLARPQGRRLISTNPRGTGRAVVCLRLVRVHMYRWTGTVLAKEREGLWCCADKVTAAGLKDSIDTLTDPDTIPAVPQDGPALRCCDGDKAVNLPALCSWNRGACRGPGRRGTPPTCIDSMHV